MRVTIFTLLLLLIIFAPVFEAEATTQAEFVPARVESVQADFVQERHLEILTSPIVSRGRFVFKAPNSLRWQYTEPFVSLLLMDDGKIRKFIEHDGKLQKDRTVRLDVMEVVFGEINAWLAGYFTENEVFIVDVIDEYTIRLLPKQAGMRGFISSIVLKLSTQPGLLDSVTIYEGNEQSFTLLLFANQILNNPQGEGLFTQP